MMSGYGGCHAWNETTKHFCSRECAAEYQYLDEEYSPATAELMSEGGTYGLMYKYSDAYGWTDMAIRSRRTNFIREGKPNDPCVFYVTWTEDNKFKFGASGNIWYRDSFSKFIDGYKCIHILKRDLRIPIADLEANIKTELKVHSEYLSIDRVPEFWKVYRKFK